MVKSVTILQQEPALLGILDRRYGGIIVARHIRRGLTDELLLFAVATRSVRSPRQERGRSRSLVCHLYFKPF